MPPAASIDRIETDLALAGAEFTVRGKGACAEVLHAHLQALGARPREDAQTRADDLPGAGEAAVVVLWLADGRRRRLRVGWAGPVRDERLRDEVSVQARCGLMHVHGRRFGTPRALPVDYATTVAGVLGCVGLIASVLRKQDHLEVDTSVAEGALLAVSQYLAGAGADDPKSVSLEPGGPPFDSADGVRFEIEALQPEPWARFCSGVGLPAGEAGRAWRAFQFRYATATACLPPRLHQLLAGRPFAEIAQLAGHAGVQVCRLRRDDEHSAELAARGLDRVTPWRIERVRAPAGAVGPEPTTPVGTEAGRGPLGGVTTVEAGRRVQAPLATHLLRLLGSDVLRVEPPGGDPLRGMPPCRGGLSARWLALNRGKRAVELDIKEPSDRDRIRELAAGSSVFLHNWAPGTAERVGLCAADLPATPLYVHASGWGGIALPDLPPGTDFMVQARSGLADLLSPPGRPPSGSLMTLLDVLGGLLAAEAAVAGLVLHQRTGAHVAAESSLFGAATTVRATAPVRAVGAQRQLRARGGRPFVRAGQDGDADVPVVDDLADLFDDPALRNVLGRDDRDCPALAAPWRFR
jgi:crotonobetainyl-CoA:carnitine CoA-transferase CaiB-like acyl-CoA transferase